MIDGGIIHALSIGLFVFTWTHFGLTNNPIVFYPMLAICCFTLYAGNMLSVKYRDFAWRVNVVGFLFTFSNLLDEFGKYIIPAILRPYMFNPTKLQINEYVILLIILTFVARANRKVWKTISYYEYFREVEFNSVMEKESINRRNIVANNYR